MKKFIFTILTMTLLFSCKDDDQLTFQQQLDEDIIEIEAYLANNGLTATKDATGVFYYIEEEGEGTEYPEATSEISMAYTGKFMDGTVFDSATSISPLKQELINLIPGWQIAIPKYKKKGKGTIYIPSGYAYGVNGTFGIPGNTILIFDIELLNFE